MTAAATKRRRRKDAPPLCESAVYDGRRLLGVILPKGQSFVGRNAAGRLVGKFGTAQLAMRAISAADRASAVKRGHG